MKAQRELFVPDRHEPYRPQVGERFLYPCQKCKRQPFAIVRTAGRLRYLFCEQCGYRTRKIGNGTTWDDVIREWHSAEVRA